MKKRLAIIATLIILLLALALPAWPAAISSNGTGGGVWSATGSWSGGVVPGEGDRATILSGDTITLDEASRTCGDDTTTAAIQVNSGGKLQYLYTAGVNGVLICKGDFKVAGTLELGTTSNPIPNTDTFNLRLNYSATLSDGEYGFIAQAGSTVTIQGSDPWGNGLTDPDRTILAANAAVNATSLTVADTTLWKDNDTICISSTQVAGSNQHLQLETGALNGDASGTTLTVDGFAGTGGGIQYAKNGTSPIQAEIINVTRNVIITSYDTSYEGYVLIQTTAIANVDWTRFSDIGYNTTDKYGITSKPTTGTVSFTRCAFVNIYGIQLINDITSGSYTIEDSVGWSCECIVIAGTGTTGNWVHDNIWAIGSESGIVYYYTDVRGSVTYCRGTNASSAFNLNPSSAQTMTAFHHNQAHNTNGGNQVIINGYVTFTAAITNLKLYIGNTLLNISGINTVIDTIEAFASTTSSSYACIDVASGLIEIKNAVLNGHTSLASAAGIRVGGAKLYLTDCDLGTASGVKTAFGTSDLYYYGFSQVYSYNSKLASTTEVSGMSGVTSRYQGLYSDKHDQTAGSFKTVVGTGSIVNDTTYYATASPSQKLTPGSATYKLESGSKKFTIDSGQTAEVAVKFRKSNAYNGAQPRLILKRNDALGITADTVLATSTASNDADTPPGTFSTLTGTTAAVTADGVLEVVVDCDGTAGYINVDDWSLSLS